MNFEAFLYEISINYTIYDLTFLYLYRTIHYTIRFTIQKLGSNDTRYVSHFDNHDCNHNVLETYFGILELALQYGDEAT